MWPCCRLVECEGPVQPQRPHHPHVRGSCVYPPDQGHPEQGLWVTPSWVWEPVWKRMDTCWPLPFLAFYARSRFIRLLPVLSSTSSSLIHQFCLFFWGFFCHCTEEGTWIGAETSAFIIKYLASVIKYIKNQNIITTIGIFPMSPTLLSPSIKLGGCLGRISKAAFGRHFHWLQTLSLNQSMRELLHCLHCLHV